MTDGGNERPASDPMQTRSARTRRRQRSPRGPNPRAGLIIALVALPFLLFYGAKLYLLVVRGQVPYVEHPKALIWQGLTPVDGFSFLLHFAINSAVVGGCLFGLFAA